MSKNRLDEGTIRRFMGLAGLKPIGESFFDRMEEQPEEEDALAPEGDPEAPPVDDAAFGADDPADDAGAAADPATAEAAAEMAQDVADAVADALTTALGQHGVTVDSGGGEAAPEAELGGEEEPMPGGEELPLEEEEEMALETATSKDDALSKLESANVELVDDDKVVQEVARRVAARLLRHTKKR